MSCAPGNHHYRPSGGVIFCGGCGDVKSLGLPGIEAPLGWTPVPVSPPAPLPPTEAFAPPAFLNIEQAERSVQQLEADLLEQMREAGVDPHDTIARAGIDPHSSVAQRILQQLAPLPDPQEQPPLPGMESAIRRATWPVRGAVAQLSEDEQALLDSSNAHEQRRIVVDGEALEHGL